MKMTWTGIDPPNPKADVLPRVAIAGAVTGDVRVMYAPSCGNEVTLCVQFEKFELRCSEETLLELLKPVILEIATPNREARCELMNGGTRPFISWQRY